MRQQWDSVAAGWEKWWQTIANGTRCVSTRMLELASSRTRVPSDDDVRCRIALDRHARWVLDYYPVDVVEDRGDEVVIDFSASDPSVAARLLLRLGDRARLIEGEEVRQALEELGERILSRYA